MTNLHETKIQEAIDILFGKGITSVSILEQEIESIHRSFAYNHIWADDNAKMGKREACDSLYVLETLIDGLRGKHLQA